MGCGASKAAQVTEADITIKAILSSAEDCEQSPHGGEPTTGDSAVNEERAMSTTQDPSSGAGAEYTDSDMPAGEASEGPRYDTFDVCFGDDQTAIPKGPPPRRLSKLESAPKLTSEMLADKQRQADERKAQELEKRASRRLSRKDRLRKQIVDARDLEIAQQHYTQIEKKQSASSVNKDRLQTEAAEKLRKREQHAKEVREKALKLSTGELDNESGSASYDPSVEMDVDLTYNTENQNEFWDPPSSENNSSINQTLPPNHSHDSDNMFYSDPKSEQYM